MENEIKQKILKEQEECKTKKEREVREAKAEVRLRREMGEQIPRYLLVLSSEISSPASGVFQFGKPQDFTLHTSGQFPGIVSTNTLTHDFKTKHKIKTEKVGLEGYVSAANLQQASTQVCTPSFNLMPPNEKKMCFSTHRSSRISNSGGCGTKRPAVYSLPTGVQQQLFGQSSSSSSFDSIRQQALYKSKEMSRFDMLLKSKLPRNHISTLVSVVNALGLSVKISDLENPKDIVPDSFFHLCAQNVAEVQHLDPVAAAPVLRKMFCRWLTTNCNYFTEVNIKILFISLFF